MMSNEIINQNHHLVDTSILSGEMKSLSNVLPLTEHDKFLFLEHCDFALSQTDLKDMLYYSSVALCALDAVFSIQARYYSVVSPLIDRICKELRIPRTLERANKMPSENEQITVPDFISKLSCSDAEELARKLRNRQRTSSRGGILKADAFLQYLDVFTELKVNTYQDVNRKVDDLEPKLRAIPGQNVSVDYFFMLAGNTDDVKVDTWINRFVSDAIGRTASSEEIKDLFKNAVQYYRKHNYPEMTVRMLDHTLWSWQRKTRGNVG